MGRKQTEETKAKISKIKMDKFIERSKDKWEEIKLLYNSGKTIKNISEITGFSNQSIHNILKINNVIIRSQGSKYIINHNFFENICTEQQAYWLGMIATDGTIRKSDHRNEIVLSLKIDDKAHIEKFLSDIESNSKVYFVNRSGSDQAYASICSKRIKQSLIKLGIHPNKSLTIIPPVLDNSIEKHFWRGCLDGDGCISFCKSQNGWNISFNGSYDMVLGFKRYTDGVVNSIRKPYKRGNIYTITFSRYEEICKILNSLYYNSVVFLDRKYKLYEEVIKWR